MPNMDKITNQPFELDYTVNAAGEKNILLQTSGKYLDRNISIDVITPAAGTASLAITDNTEDDVTIGAAANGKYPVSADIAGTMAFGSAGWVSAAGDSAEDEGVQVGLIDQSTMTLDGSALASGSNIIPDVANDKAVAISAGYEGARSLTVKSMSAGTQAAATSVGSAEATTPTLTNTTDGLGTGKEQIAVVPSASGSGVDKYYAAVTAGAPATSLEFSTTVGTAGYLGQASQISASGATTANSELFYIPLATGAVSAEADAVTATDPTLANDSTAAINGKTKITAAPTSDSSSVSEDFYMAVKATAPATNVTVTPSVTEGYIKSGDVSVEGVSVAAADETFYIPVAAGTKSAAAGSVSASSSNMSISAAQAQPESGYYFTAVGSGTANIGAGWYNAATTQQSNEATGYYTVPQATFSANGADIEVATAGYIGVGDTVGTVASGSLSTVSADPGNTYTEISDAVLTANGWLKLEPGYYGATKISTATLVPDGTSVQGHANYILAGETALDEDGNLVTGSIQTYDGAYTIT